MKIAYLCSDVDVPVFGQEGCSVHIQELAGALTDLGHEVSLTCACLGQPPPYLTKFRYRELRPDGLDATAWDLVQQEPSIHNNNLERDLGSVFFNLRLQCEGAKIMEEERPDLLYERYSLFGWGGIELSRRHGIPLILEVNSPLLREQTGYEKFQFVETARRMDVEIFLGAGEIVVVSQWLKDWIASLGVEESRIHVIANAVAARRFSSPLPADVARADLGLTGERVVGYIGSFQDWHDVRGLLDAFAQVHQQRPDVRLLLVGQGSGRRAVEAAAAQKELTDAILFTGHVPHADIPRKLAAMDVAVVPYGPMPDYYFSPLKLFESMAMGIPTVAADIGQIAEVVRQGETGWLYPPGDRSALAEGIAAFLDQPERAARIGKAARQYILAHHTWDAVAEQVVTIGQNLLARR